MGLLLGLLGCDAADGPPDAARCSVAPVAPRDAVVRADALFDVSLDGRADFEVLVEDGELIVVAWDRVLRFDLGGTLLGSTPFAVPGAEGVFVFEVVAGSGGYGAIAEVYGGPDQGPYFCLLGPGGSFDIDRCVPAGPTGGFLVFDDDAYRHYFGLSGELLRASYDPVTAEGELRRFTASDAEVAGVLGAVAVSGSSHVLTRDWMPDTGCYRPRLHEIASGGAHEVRELVPADMTAAPSQFKNAIAADDAGITSIVSASCALADCEAAPEAALLLDGRAVGARMDVIVRDDGRTVTIGDRTQCNEEGGDTRCSTWLELARFGPDGAMERTPVRVTEEILFADSLRSAAAVIGPGDYVIAYWGSEASRLTRVLVP